MALPGMKKSPVGGGWWRHRPVDDGPPLLLLRRPRKGHAGAASTPPLRRPPLAAYRSFWGADAGASFSLFFTTICRPKLKAQICKRECPNLKA